MPLTAGPPHPVFTVQRAGSGPRPGRIIGLVVSGLLLVTLGYWVGSQDVTPGLTAALARAGLEDRRGELERQVEQLRARLVIAERSAQVAELASEQVRREQIAQQDEVRALRTEIAFYRGILAERNGAPGPRLHGFAMDPATGRLDLVLVRGRPDGKAVEGHLEVRLVAPGAELVDAQDLYSSLAPVARTAYAFEFFQRIELPLGLQQPSVSLLVTLLPGDGGKPFHFLRTWPEASMTAGREG